MRLLVHRWLIPGLLMVLSGCGESRSIRQKNVEFPGDSLIPMEQMTAIMTDVHILEAALLNQRNEGADPAKDSIQAWYNGLFRKYGISRNRFDQNLKYYRSDPQEFGRMYEKIVETIKERQKNYQPKK